MTFSQTIMALTYHEKVDSLGVRVLLTVFVYLCESVRIKKRFFVGFDKYCVPMSAKFGGIDYYRKCATYTHTGGS